MKQKLSRILIIITVLLIISYLLPYCLSESYSRSYQLLDHPDGSQHYRLNVAISESLYEYYREKSQFNKPTSINEFDEFVTPYALKPIADRLWEIYTDDEDFANGVLMIVHQIPYEETAPTQYPVETMVENRGDCDLFSFIAASIMYAGGLDVVLLYYESKSHMNVGVRLSHIPRDVRGQAYYVTYKDIRYYIAECTGGEWESGWRVGECPIHLRQADAQIITLENIEQWSPGQVSASYKTLASSTMSLEVSSTFVLQGSSVTLSGQLIPTLQNKTVTIYTKTNNLPWIVLGTVTTDSAGRFKYVLNISEWGICYVRVSWSGDNDYAGADSQIQSIVIVPTFLILLLIIAVLICVGTVVFFVSRQSRQKAQEPQPPESSLCV
jgi:hypothetical protein